jgi:hypothetical protein
LSEAKVDLLVANLGTLPFLKLQWAQINRLKPTVPFRYLVRASHPVEGEEEWLKAQGIEHEIGPEKLSHYDGLKKLIPLSTAPIIGFMDADTIPFKKGWLDSAVALLESDPKIAAVGLSHFTKTQPDSPRRNHTQGTMYCHPAFALFRRDIYDQVGLDPTAKILDNGDWFDAGGTMSPMLEAAGYQWEPLGIARNEEAQFWTGQKVFHVGCAALILLNARISEEYARSYTDWHRYILGRMGLWEDFAGYLKESFPVNPYISRYGEL